MTAADQIRALADTGTPGPWYFNVPAHHGDTAIGRRAEDAAKIVAAVNALPALADLIDALSHHTALLGEADFPICLACEGIVEFPCPTAAARDALVEALGVTA